MDYNDEETLNELLEALNLKIFAGKRIEEMKAVFKDFVSSNLRPLSDMLVQC